VRRAQRTGTAYRTEPVPKVESLSIDLPLLVTLRWKSILAPRGGEIMADWIAELRMSSCCRMLLFDIAFNRIQ
jgi:hypothetical protein